MDLTELIEAVKVLFGEDDANLPDDNVILVYLREAETELQLKYCSWDTTKTLPSIYEPLVAKLAVRKLARRGGEGESSHNENGISRQYASVDDKDIISQVTPLGRVIL